MELFQNSNGARRFRLPHENLKETESEIIDKERKQHLKSLQDISQMRFIRNELLSLKDMGFLRGKFEEGINWKALALNSIAILKDKIKKKDTPPHEHIFTKISNIDVDELSNDDPLCIGVIDLSSDKYNIPESDYESLVGEKANIRNLSKDVVGRSDTRSMGEDDHIKERIARGITDVLLQEIKLNALRRISRDYEVEVTRAERQSTASKNRKAQQKSGSRGDKPDLMFRAHLRQKWEEIVFFESEKWDANEDKICHDHNKLVQLCLDGSKQLVKNVQKKPFTKEKGMKYHLHLPVVKAKIPLGKESVEEVEEFVHALLTLR
ncbi:7254_t:CDS:2, partial [Paraglomus brasilianum]